jgi:hypothetical protein
VVQGVGRDLVFINEGFVTVDAFSSTIQDGIGINLSPIVYNSNFNSDRRSLYISNCFWCYMRRLNQSDISDGTRSTMG